MSAGTAVRWLARHGAARFFLTQAARRGDVHGRIMMDPALRLDPYPAYEQLRAAGPFYRGKFSLVTVDHEICSAVLRSDDFGTAVGDRAIPPRLRKLLSWTDDEMATGAVDAPALLAVDPPVHTRYRRLVAKVFTARAIEALRHRVEERAEELLDALEGAPTADLVQRYCSLLPVIVIAEMLGVPVADREKFLAWGEAAAPSLDLGLGYRAFRETEDNVRALNTYMYGHLEGLRRNPGSDILSQLVTARTEDGRLNARELVATASLLLAAGFETTVNLLGNGAVLLMRHPEQLAALRAEPSLWPNAVEEVLRIDPPVQTTGRRALRDTELAGRQIPAGTIVVTILAGANRDPGLFVAPERFDVHRANARDHLSFSLGVHFCLGAALARMEGEIGLRKLFERFPDLHLVGEPTRRPTRTLRGFEAIPVSLRSPRVAAPA